MNTVDDSISVLCDPDFRSALREADDKNAIELLVRSASAKSLDDLFQTMDSGGINDLLKIGQFKALADDLVAKWRSFKGCEDQIQDCELIANEVNDPERIRSIVQRKSMTAKRAIRLPRDMLDIIMAAGDGKPELTNGSLKNQIVSSYRVNSLYTRKTIDIKVQTEFRGKQTKDVLTRICADISDSVRSPYVIDFLLAILRKILESIDNPSSGLASRVVTTIRWEDIDNILKLSERVEVSQYYEAKSALSDLVGFLQRSTVTLYKANDDGSIKGIDYQMFAIKNISRIDYRRNGTIRRGFDSCEIGLTDFLADQLFGHHGEYFMPSFSLIDLDMVLNAASLGTEGKHYIKRTRYQRLVIYIAGLTYDAFKDRIPGQIPVVNVSISNLIEALGLPDGSSENESSDDITGILPEEDRHIRALARVRKAKGRAIDIADELLSLAKGHGAISGFSFNDNGWEVAIGSRSIQFTKNILNIRYSGNRSRFSGDQSRYSGDQSRFSGNRSR